MGSWGRHSKIRNQPQEHLRIANPGHIQVLKHFIPPRDVRQPILDRRYITVYLEHREIETTPLFLKKGNLIATARTPGG